MRSDATLTPFDRIRALPLWRGPVEIVPLSDGVTNRTYFVAERGRRAVVRLGGDVPEHGVMRFNEQAASRAAAAAGISPAVLHAEPDMLVLAHIDAPCLTPATLRAQRERCVALVRRAHEAVARHLRGPALAFNAFHVLGDYARTLAARRGRHAVLLPELTAAAEALCPALGPVELVFAHNDLLAANFIDDGSRIWLIDWDYAGFNTPLFDLGGLAANNGFSAAEEEAMLAAYFGALPRPALRRRYAAAACAARLRETMWSMVSEGRPADGFDYPAYTDATLLAFRRAYAAFRAGP